VESSNLWRRLERENIVIGYGMQRNPGAGSHVWGSVGPLTVDVLGRLGLVDRGLVAA